MVIEDEDLYASEHLQHFSDLPLEKPSEVGTHKNPYSFRASHDEAKNILDWVYEDFVMQPVAGLKGRGHLG